MVQNAIQEWEIDPSKLIIKDAIIRSNRGNVHHGIYDGKHVNVKLISWMRDHDDSYSTTGFMQEVAVWQNLDHPNVSKFVGATLSSSLLAIVNKHCCDLPMNDCCVVEEYLPAGDLRSYIDENSQKKLSLKVVISLALDVARGLSYLHSLNIVHRNIKPENLLLDKAHRVKISEFGVARVAATYPRRMTQIDETSNYTAPEVLKKALYNRKCDVYSFGICLWEIYCCAWPYPKHPNSVVPDAVVEQNLRPEIPQCCPSSLANVMTRCWDANPHNRPEMEEVLSLLEAIDISKGRGMISRESSHEGSLAYPTKKKEPSPEGSPAYPTKKKSHGWSFFRMLCGS